MDVDVGDCRIAHLGGECKRQLYRIVEVVGFSENRKEALIIVWMDSLYEMLSSAEDHLIRLGYKRKNKTYWSRNGI